MALITEMELPALDVMDAELRGPRFHDTMLALRDRTWLPPAPFRHVLVDRGVAAGAVFGCGGGGGGARAFLPPPAKRRDAGDKDRRAVRHRLRSFVRGD